MMVVVAMILRPLISVDNIYIVYADGNFSLEGETEFVCLWKAPDDKMRAFCGFVL